MFFFFFCNICNNCIFRVQVNHSNLVKLEGFCIDSATGDCYLVYEYVENGSLDLWLLDREDHARRLNWRARLHIALDLAHGLQYIHEHTWPRVVHKDIKSSNVLLDARMRARVANFGLAKTGPQRRHHAHRRHPGVHRTRVPGRRPRHHQDGRVRLRGRPARASVRVRGRGPRR